MSVRINDSEVKNIASWIKSSSKLPVSNKHQVHHAKFKINAGVFNRVNLFLFDIFFALNA